MPGIDYLLPNTPETVGIINQQLIEKYRMARISSTWRVVFMSWKMTARGAG